LPEAIPLDIVFENSDLIVVDKPPGMVVHPSAGHGSGTLVNAVLAHAPDLTGVGGELRPGIVHRLDRDTSGLVVVAKNEAALKMLQAQFRDREVEKVYLALVDGRPPDRRGRIEAPIGRDPRHRQRMGIVPAAKGRSATTDYHLRQAFSQHALLEVMPRTGRTHQIRVHLAFLGCPVAGDRVYGFRRPSLGLGRHMLHAWRVRFRLPGQTATERTFEAPLPDDLVEAIARAGGPVTTDDPA
jgi:23S rRNA pseudouridine1911/1915/1917 synthase